MTEPLLEALEADFHRYFPDILAHASDWVAEESSATGNERS